MYINRGVKLKIATPIPGDLSLINKYQKKRTHLMKYQHTANYHDPN